MINRIYQNISTLLLFFLMACFFAGVSVVPTCAAEDDIGLENAVIRPISDTGYDDSHDFSENPEDYYDVMGVLDDVQEDGLVIGDIYFKKASNAKITGTRVGAHVGIVLFHDKVVLCEPVSKPSGK